MSLVNDIKSSINKEIALNRELKGYLYATVIKAIIRSEEHDGLICGLAFNLLSGSLNDLIRKRKKYGEPFPVSFIKNTMQSILKGVGHLHSKGIIHRDLKPENILYDDKKKMILCDFGLSNYSSNMNGVDNVTRCGTSTYASAEAIYQITIPDYRFSDMFSIGCILYEMITLEKFNTSADVNDVLSRQFSVFGTPSEEECHWLYTSD